jgi:GNAT superfamily N-acetyltransferase
VGPLARLSPRRLARRTLETFREGGPRAVLWETLAMAGARRLEIHCRPAEPETAQAVAEIAVRPLSPGDAEAYRDLAPFPEITGTEFRRRLRAGERCFGAWQGERLVGACWLAFEEAQVSYLGLSIRFAHDACYFYEVFTARDQRRLGVGSLVHAAALADASSAGKANVLSGLLAENEAGAALIGPSSRPLGAVTSMRLGRWRVWRSSLPPGYVRRVRPLPRSPARLLFRRRQAGMG